MQYKQYQSTTGLCSTNSIKVLLDYAVQTLSKCYWTVQYKQYQIKDRCNIILFKFLGDKIA